MLARAMKRALSTAPPPLAPGFMQRVAAGGVDVLLGAFCSSPRFDRVLEGLTVTRVSSGAVECELIVAEAHSNSYGTLHGGCTATIVDIVGTMACLTKDPLRPGVSVDMAQTFLSAAKVGDKVWVEGKCLRSGKRLAFTEVVLRKDSRDGELVATGRHTKAL
jgi:acyl-coenzyme A thioesterase 13